MANTHPNTPFAKLFVKLGIWHPTVEETIQDLYNKLTADEKIASEKASGIIAIITNAEKNTPDEVFQLIQTKFPDITREKLEELINTVLGYIRTADQTASLPLEDALKALYDYLAKYEGNAWVSTVRYVVELLTAILAPEGTLIQKLTPIIEFVYQNIVKGWLSKVLQGVVNK